MVYEHVNSIHNLRIDTNIIDLYTIYTLKLVLYLLILVLNFTFIKIFFTFLL